MTREEAIEALTSKDVCNSDIMLEALDMAIKALEQELKTGHWIDVKGYEGLLCMCSNCCKDNERYKHRTHQSKTKFCPDCGAKMVEPQESEGKHE